MNEQIKLQAKELEKQFTGYIDVNTLNDSYRQYFTDWERLMQTMAAVEIRARMQETDRYLDVIAGGSNNEYYVRRRVELNKQLESLEVKS